VGEREIIKSLNVEHDFNVNVFGRDFKRSNKYISQKTFAIGLSLKDFRILKIEMKHIGQRRKQSTDIERYINCVKTLSLNSEKL